MFVCVWIFVLICIDRLEGTGAVQFSQHQATTFGANIEKLNCKKNTLYEWKKVPPCGECLHEWNIGAFTGNWRQCPPSFIKNEVYSYVRNSFFFIDNLIFFYVLKTQKNIEQRTIVITCLLTFFFTSILYWEKSVFKLAVKLKSSLFLFHSRKLVFIHAGFISGNIRGVYTKIYRVV